MNPSTHPPDIELSDYQLEHPEWMAIHVGLKPINVAKAYAWLKANNLVTKTPTRSGVVNLCVKVLAALFDESPNSQTIGDQELLDAFFADTPSQKNKIKHIMPNMTNAVHKAIELMED